MMTENQALFYLNFIGVDWSCEFTEWKSGNITHRYYEMSNDELCESHTHTHTHMGNFQQTSRQTNKKIKIHLDFSLLKLNKSLNYCSFEHSFN